MDQNNKPTISVAMATYNGVKFIQAQLESLARQDLLPTELIISDDASTDNTLRIVEEFSRTSPFPIFIHKNSARLGYRENFLRATAYCQSDLIAFCDQDDIWMKNKLAECVAKFTSPEVLLCYHNANILSAASNLPTDLSSLAAKGDVTPSLKGDPWVHGQGFSQVFRRSLLEFNFLWPTSINHHHPTERMAHDQWIAFLAHALGSTTYISDPLVSYRLHDNNTCGWHETDKLTTKLAKVLTPDRQRYANFQAASEARSKILSIISSAEEEPRRTRSKLGSEMYTLIALAYAARQNIYSNQDFMRRIGAYYFLLKNGSYDKHTPWSLGKNAQWKDAFIGIPLGSMITRRIQGTWPFKH